MAQIVVRNLDGRIVDALKRRAERNNRSLEAEVRDILEQASTQYGWKEAWERVDTIREGLKTSGRAFSDSTDHVRDDRESH